MRAAAAIRDYSGEVVSGWNRFWFSPQDPATLSLIRICAGAMLLYTHLVWSLDLMAFFGPDGWLPEYVVSQQLEGRYIWSFFWLVDSAAGVWAIHIGSLIVFALLTVGYQSRIVAVLAFVAAVSYTGRAPAALFGLDKINCMLAMYLMIGPSGARYSIDRWLARRRAGGGLDDPPPSVSANLAIRLIQLHMCIIYLFSGLGKLQGVAWWDGTAVWMAHANLEYQSLDMTWLAGWPKLIAFMTHATVFWELFYVALIWHRLWRPFMLFGAIVVHGGIAVALGMITFGLVMLIGNLAFVSPRLVRSIIDPIFARGRAGEAPAGAARVRAAETAPRADRVAP
jgi:hypothetical protein